MIAGVSLREGEEIVLQPGRADHRHIPRGLIHIGEGNFPPAAWRCTRRWGRAEPPSIGLSKTLYGLGLAMGRLKTGTPPRLDGRTIDWAALEMQAGDAPPAPFSFLTRAITTPQIACGITRTTPGDPRHHSRQPAPRADLFRPDRGTGPRYCPSIEDKVSRFADRE